MSLFNIPLNDQTPLFKSDYTHPHFEERTHVNINLDTDLNPYWTQLIESKGLQIYRVELFYGPKDFPYTMGIHTDRGYGDWGKINWVFGGDGCEMFWYRPLSAEHRAIKETAVHSNYNLYEPHEVKTLCSAKITTPSIVQVGIPHNIVNPGKERWCYSMVINDPETNNMVTFGRLKKAFGK
jgi:hypothetical protein